MDWFTTYLVPIAFGIYGLIFLLRTPSFMGRNGLTTKQSRRSEETWRYFHRIAGIYCVAAAILTGVLAYLQVQAMNGETLPMLFWIRMVIELAVIAAMIPLVNGLTKRKFPAGTEDGKETKKE